MRDRHNPANEKPLYFELPVYSNRFLFAKALPLPSFLWKKKSFSLPFLLSCLWFCPTLFVPNCNSLPFSNNPFFFFFLLVK